MPPQPTSAKYVCPISQIEYQGRCPIQDCWSNIGNTHPSGCLTIKMNQRLPDSAVLAEVFNLKTRSVDQQVDEGNQQLQLALELLDTFQHLESRPDYTACIHCGIQVGSGSSCLNRIKCDARRKLAAQIVRLPALRILTVEPMWSMQILFRVLAQPGILKRMVDFLPDYTLEQLGELTRTIQPVTKPAKRAR